MAERDKKLDGRWKMREREAAEESREEIMRL